MSIKTSIFADHIH